MKNIADRTPYWKLNLGLLVALLALLVGCSSLWQSLKSAAAPAAGGAAGAGVGMLAGPAGAIGGEAVGAMVGDSLEESASLRSGETVGEGALEREMARWQGRAVAAERAASLSDQARDWLVMLLWYAGVGIVGWFGWRNRHNIRERGLVRGLWHSVMGGKFGKG